MISNKKSPRIGPATLILRAPAIAVAALAVLFGNVVSPITRGVFAAASPGPSARQQQEGRPQERPGSIDDQLRVPSRGGAPSILVAPNEDYRIGPRDVIEVRVDDAPELSGTFSINAAGTFPMNYLGRITALNKTPDELADLIAAGLKGRYLLNPHVSVKVAQYNSRSFFIQGAVRAPGVYQLEGKASLLKLIILAGGLMENHGSTAFIIRQIKRTPGASEPATVDGANKPAAGDAAVSDNAGPATRPRTLAAETGKSEKGPDAAVAAQTPNAKGATSSGAANDPAKAAEPADGEHYELKTAKISGLLKGHFDQNVYVEPGDIVNIPVTDVFFVAGEVRGPGSFPIAEGTTLRQAITLARGTTFKAATGRSVIFREDPETGTRKTIKVDVSAVMSGKKEDIPLMANDIIVVPNSAFKSTGGTLLQAFGTTMITRGIP